MQAAAARQIPQAERAPPDDGRQAGSLDDRRLWRGSFADRMAAIREGCEREGIDFEELASRASPSGVSSSGPYTPRRPPSA